MTLKIESIQDEAGFHSLESEWNTLLNASHLDNIFLTWEWVSTWWKNFQPGRQLFLLTARDQASNLVGIAPLIIQPINIHFRVNNRPARIKLPLKELAFIGSNGASPDHLDFIIHPDHQEILSILFIDALDALNLTKPSWHIINFSGIQSTSPIIQHLTANPQNAIFTIERQIPYITIPDSWDDLLSPLSKSQRYYIRRKLRKVEKDFPDQVTHELVDAPEKISPMIQKMLVFSRENRSEPAPSRAGEISPLDTFFVEISRRFHENGWLRLFTLSIQGEVVSIQNCFHQNQKAYYYQTGYHQEWSKYSPGTVNFSRSLQYFIEDQVQTFDLLRGEHEYKDKWSATSSSDIQILTASSWIGKAYISFHQMGRRIKKNLF